MRERLSTTVTAESHEWLRTEAARQRISVGELIDQLIAREREERK